jgi:GPH family glycoside/pentoside/hexuronide:cation symporter
MAPLNNPYSWPTALFFWITSMGFNFFYVVVGAPYGAMMPEQSETEKNRIKISAIQGIFNIVGSVLGIVLPILIQSTLPDPQQSMYNTPSGEKMTTLVPLLGLLFGIILVGCVIFTMFTVDESFFLKECEEPQEKRTIKSVLTQFAQPFKHDNTREFYWSTFASNMSMRILMTVLLPIATYVLILIGTEFLIFIAILVPITVVGFLIWTSIVGKLGTQRSYAYSLYGLAIPCFLSLFLLIPMSHTFTMVLGIALIGIALAMLVGQFLFTNPIMSSLVDEGQQRAEEFGFKPNTNLAGAYFGMWGFIINVASGLANMILGVIYTGNNKTDPFYLVISLPIAGFLILLTVYYLNNVRIRKKITQ